MAESKSSRELEDIFSEKSVYDRSKVVMVRGRGAGNSQENGATQQAGDSGVCAGAWESAAGDEEEGTRGRKVEWFWRESRGGRID